MKPLGEVVGPAMLPIRSFSIKSQGGGGGGGGQSRSGGGDGLEEGKQGET